MTQDAELVREWPGSRAVLGEARCCRPEGHLHEHKADSPAMRIEWYEKRLIDGPGGAR